VLSTTDRTILILLYSFRILSSVHLTSTDEMEPSRPVDVYP